MEKFVYREEVKRTAALDSARPRSKQLAMGAMGLAGEAGEVVDLLKKEIFHGKPADKSELLKELGDVRWYLEYLAIVNGFTMEEIEETNVAKLRARYPDGFSSVDSIAKKDEAGV